MAIISGQLTRSRPSSQPLPSTPSFSWVLGWKPWSIQKELHESSGSGVPGAFLGSREPKLHKGLSILTPFSSKTRKAGTPTQLPQSLVPFHPYLPSVVPTAWHSFPPEGCNHATKSALNSVPTFWSSRDHGFQGYSPALNIFKSSLLDFSEPQSHRYLTQFVASPHFLLYPLGQDTAIPKIYIWFDVLRA